MNSPIIISPVIETEPFHINEALENFNNSLLLYLDQNKLILDPEGSETGLSQKIVWSLIEITEELKKQIQAFYGSVSEKKEENCETKQEVVKIKVKTEEQEESPCNCLVCKLLETGEIKIEEENEGNIETEKKLVLRLKQQQRKMEEVDENLEKVEEKHQELLKTLEQLEGEKLFAEKKMIKVANQNKELLKNLEELKAEKLIVDEKLAQEEDQYLFIVKVEEKNQELLKDLEELKISQLAMKRLEKESDEMKNQNQILLKTIKEIEVKNQELYKDYEELKACQLIKDEKLAEAEITIQQLLEELDHKQAEIEERNQELKAVHQRLTKAEDQNQDLFKNFEEWERDILRTSADFERTLIKKSLEAMNLTKENEEISQQFEQKSKKQSMRVRDRDNFRRQFKSHISCLEEANEILRNKLNRIDVKVANLVHQISCPSKLVGVDFKFNFREDNGIILNLKQLTEYIPKLKLAILRLISSNSQISETEILQDISNRDQREDRLIEELQQISHEENKENGFLEQTLPPISTSITLNSKRNFESVGGDSKKQDNVFNTQQEDQGDDLNYEQPLIKKLKNN